MTAKIFPLRKQHKMRVPYIHHRPRDLALNPVNPDPPLHHPRHAHPTLNPDLVPVTPDQATPPDPTMRPQCHLFQALALRKPRSHTASPIPTQLRLAAIGVKQAQKHTPIPAPVHKLNAIRPHACMPRAQFPRHRGMLPQRQRLLNHKEVVSPRLRLHKPDRPSHPQPLLRQHTRAVPRKSNGPHHSRCEPAEFPCHPFVSTEAQQSPDQVSQLQIKASTRPTGTPASRAAHSSG